MYFLHLLAWGVLKCELRYYLFDLIVRMTSPLKYLFLPTVPSNWSVFVPPIQSFDLATNVGYERTCEGRAVELECPRDMSLHIYNAMYGRSVSYGRDPVCPRQSAQNQSTMCAVNAMATMQKMCNGQESCQVSVRSKCISILNQLLLDWQSAKCSSFPYVEIRVRVLGASRSRC